MNRQLDPGMRGDTIQGLGFEGLGWWEGQVQKASGKLCFRIGLHERDLEVANPCSRSGYLTPPT